MTRPRLVLAVMIVASFALADAPIAAAADPTPDPTAPSPSPTPAPRPAPGPTGPVEKKASEVKLRKLAGGTSVVRGKGTVFGKKGKLVRYSVEVQTRMPHAKRRAVQLEAVTRWVFGDEKRGWTARGARRMQRVGTVSDAKIRILLAKPSEVDRRCRRGGANTAGLYSCFNGYKFAALNKTRWLTGPLRARFPSLVEYRAYLVNHEVGHGLGYGHARCPRKGALAKVMLPQSRVTYGCRANGWPYPGKRA